MAEQVNQRIEGMINELEQMRRTSMYNDEEIKEIARKRKEFEYRIQRRVKMKEDFVHYIAYELALLEDICIRRKKINMSEKKKDIEYAIAKRVNKIFKQFIYRFQNDIEVYFEYIKFCKNVGFDVAISGIIGQMLQIHGDKPKMWQMASKWEMEQNNLEAARAFLLKGIHRHPESEALYLDLFEIELLLICKADDDEQKEKQLKRIEIVWRNGLKNINNVSFLFKICDLSLKYDLDKNLSTEIKKEIWSQRDVKEVWCYVAAKELEGCHWDEIDEFVEEDYNFPKVLNNFINLYEAALQQFHDEKLFSKYIHQLLGINQDVCSDLQKINAVKHAWLYGHENGLLSNDMYSFGIKMLKLENTMSNDDIMEILSNAASRNPKIRCIWEEKILLNTTNEKQMLFILQQASKYLDSNDTLYLWNIVLDNVQSSEMLQDLYKKFQMCESYILLVVKPKLLQKMYNNYGLKAARELYEEFVRTPPTQIEVHNIMIDIEKSQEKLNLKNIRKYYECAVQQHGKDSVEIWSNYIQFEVESGNASLAPAIYRRAIAMLDKNLVDTFIKVQTLNKLK